MNHESVERYLQSRFGEALERTRKAMGKMAVSGPDQWDDCVAPPGALFQLALIPMVYTTGYNMPPLRD